ncbi:extracellular solute-binding protein [Paenibacillus sp. LMG 31456]|uniref:Extracellular solute-binding protein n=1 Tax=Paenibacillus foliorum TaxID=2654974 RepID=A0A972K0H7_9BACL|nr:extracellular solute-binding protein [Paenibacillus foliorum]NOU91702.1 extracellular solute-binding protein [Paenibacillus foliorum]
MVHYKKSMAGIMSIALLGGMTLAGCSGASKTENPKAAEPAAQAKETDWKTVKADIRFVYPGTSEAEKELAEQFKTRMKEKYPNVNIEYMFLSWQDMEKKLAVMINSNDWPDITMTQDITNLAQLDGLEDLKPYLEKKGTALKKEDFLPGTLEYGKQGDKVYSIPSLANSFTLLVNEKMLNEAGMKLDELKTWADVEKAAQLMTKDGKFGFGYPLGVPRFAFRVPFTAAYSNDLILDDTSDASKKKYIETLEHFKKLEAYGPKAQLTWGYPEMWRAFSNGEVGIVAAGTYFSANVYSINPEIMKLARAIPYPQGPSGTKAKAPVSSVGVGMFKGSKNKEVVWRLIEEWSSNEFNSTQAATVNISALTKSNFDEIIKKAEKIYPKAIEGHKRVTQDFNQILATSGVPMATIPGQTEMEVIVQENMAKLLTGKSTTEEAYKSIKENIDKIKAKNK